MSGRREVVLGTWRALARPRRAVPLALVAAALLATEALAARSATAALALALLVDALLVLAFCLVAPASWRLLAATGDGGARGVGKLAAYLAVGAAVVLALGLALPLALGLPGTYVADAGSLGVLLALYWVGGWGLGRDVELELGLHAARRRAADATLEAERAQVLALRAHLDPHFLFNTLNAIAEWCREDPAVAEAATLRLASLLRTILVGIRSPTWPLASELALLREVFALYEVRDATRFRLSLDVPDPVPEAAVPPMLLLPLFENALTHGPAAGHDGALALRIRETPGAIELELRNPGAYGGRREGGEGIGLVERRLVLAYGDAARVELRAEGASTVAAVRFPRRVSAAEELAR